MLKKKSYYIFQLSVVINIIKICLEELFLCGILSLDNNIMLYTRSVL